MDPIELIKRFGDGGLSAEEDAELFRELAEAYRIDKAAATDVSVARIARIVQLRAAAAKRENTSGNPASGEG
jgi:hypothetical protein